ncbi:hypothetical protein GGS23DRAFT_92510 [Durotheca rogersii]|uniref:uncharacterized protein n=1 Tax=Durotheca rogersii TaxID=419775 RepID=UPI002220F9A2|nr:uncharacterized protein GGS23DRAFT_92510 [Durotheca rogersii]KAI5862313.1 hypothetical protein GGS23DRAFT_92510 [Durotheca rogersii]
MRLHNPPRIRSLANPPHSSAPPSHRVRIPSGSHLASARSISSTRRTAEKVRAVPHRDTFARVRFTVADVPPPSVWAPRARDLLLPEDDKLIHPEACSEACGRYAALAISGERGWRHRALSASVSSHGNDSRILLYTLHYAAVMMITRPPVLAGHLATHILHTGAMLDYAPSALTLARIALRRGLFNGPQFLDARGAVERLARKDSNSSPYYRPDALTLLGLAQIQRQNQQAGADPEADDRALRYFEEAAQIFADARRGSGDGDGRPAAVAWQWFSSAVLAQARIYLRRGWERAAVTALRIGVYELDNAEAHYELAQLLRTPSPGETEPGTRREGEKGGGAGEWMNLLQKAAISNVDAAARELAHLELCRADAGTDGEDGLTARERRVLADEWLGIAGDEATVN